MALIEDLLYAQRTLLLAVHGRQQNSEKHNHSPIILNGKVVHVSQLQPTPYAMPSEGVASIFMYKRPCHAMPFREKTRHVSITFTVQAIRPSLA